MSANTGKQLSAAIEALAISLYETRALAYSLERKGWHALTPSEQGDYQGLAIDTLRKLKPAPQPFLALPEAGYFQFAVQGVRDYRARVLGFPEPSTATCLVSAADHAEHFGGKE